MTDKAAGDVQQPEATEPAGAGLALPNPGRIAAIAAAVGATVLMVLGLTGYIENIRLADSRPLLQTYAQTQAIRLYYQFKDVATDRYHLVDGYHKVMLSTRELSNDLPASAQT